MHERILHRFAVHERSQVSVATCYFGLVQNECRIKKTVAGKEYAAESELFHLTNGTWTTINRKMSRFSWRVLDSKIAEQRDCPLAFKVRMISIIVIHCRLLNDELPTK